MNVLFVTWDGPQVSYLEGLFLPIFQSLHRGGLRFSVLQFTWGDADRIERTQQSCDAAGVSYRSLRVWRRPVAFGSFVTAVAGGRHVADAIRRDGIDVVMPRSTMPALASMLAVRRKNVRLVFDADGLPLDERVDFGGQEPSSLAQRVLRAIEARTVRRADVVMTRSSKAADILLARAGAGTHSSKFHVVRNGRDAARFSPGSASDRARRRREVGCDEHAPVLVYAGSLGPQYCLAEMLHLFKRVLLRRPDARLLLLTGEPQVARTALAARPELSSAVRVMTVPPAEVPGFLACADLGLALRRPSFSMQAVAPIKLGEYLLCGLPVLGTHGIGDTNALLEQAGLFLNRMDEAELASAAEWFVDVALKSREAYRTRARDVGLARFSLDACVQSYLDAFATLLETGRYQHEPGRRPGMIA
jgi:glycosyltransferase involved in cell wall biosynthesis